MLAAACSRAAPYVQHPMSVRTSVVGCTAAVRIAQTDMRTVMAALDATAMASNF
jgi:hypothetical protein